MRAAALLAALFLGLGGAACGAGPAQPPHGPHYDPVNSPEASSPCPRKWQAAKQAREGLLGTAGAAREAAAGRAAAAVFAQAECESARFAARRIEAGSQEAMVAALRRARGDYDGVVNLYREAAGYGQGRVRVGAWAQLARLHLAMARLLEDLPAPLDVHGPAARAEVRRQMSQLAAGFQAEAALAATRALEAAAVLPSGAAAGDPELTGWIRRSCGALEVLDPEGLARQPACRGPAAGP